MAIDKVREYFRKYNMEDRVQEFDVSSATVEEAAKALNTEGKRIAKTMSFKLQDKIILVVLAGDARISNSKYKQTFHEKCHMLPFEEVEPLVGHPVGGVCPFAINDGVRVYLDESLKRFETVFPACGSASSAIELSIPELEKYSNPVSWVDVSNYEE